VTCVLVIPWKTAMNAVRSGCYQIANQLSFVVVVVRDLGAKLREYRPESSGSSEIEFGCCPPLFNSLPTR
jgi:hypothetical protein